MKRSRASMPEWFRSLAKSAYFSIVASALVALSACVSARTTVAVGSTEGEPGIDIAVISEGAALPGVTVRRSRVDEPSIIEERFTDASGEAHLITSPGRHRIVLSLSGFGRFERVIEVAENERTSLMVDWPMPPMGTLTIACPPPLWAMHPPGTYIISDGDIEALP